MLLCGSFMLLFPDSFSAPFPKVKHVNALLKNTCIKAFFNPCSEASAVSRPASPAPPSLSQASGSALDPALHNSP